jgi:hypothetical protein
LNTNHLNRFNCSLQDIARTAAGASHSPSSRTFQCTKRPMASLVPQQ